MNNTDNDSSQRDTFSDNYEPLSDGDNNGVRAFVSKQNPGHRYAIEFGGMRHMVSFQDGPVGQYGFNGFTSEALLEILIDRTNYLNEQFPCEENTIALGHLEEALESFNQRTQNRIARGVEGENKP